MNSNGLAQQNAAPAALPATQITSLVYSLEGRAAPGPLRRVRAPAACAPPNPHIPAPNRSPSTESPRSAFDLETDAEPWPGQILRRRWEPYCERLKECRKSQSAESVHQLRVAIRRLISQVMLLDCVLPGDRPGKTLRKLKRQLKLLGPLRDNHVQQLFFERHATRFPELLLLRSWYRRREGKLLKAAAREVRRFDSRKLGKSIRAHIEALSMYSINESARHRLVTLALNHVAAAFAEAVERRRAIDFSDLATIHRTRVAFKKFRYLAESLPPAISGPGKRELRRMAGYQRRMGNIQDLEVIHAAIGELARREPGLEPLLRPFCAYLRRRRSRALLSFRKAADLLFEFRPRALPARNRVSRD